MDLVCDCCLAPVANWLLPHHHAPSLLFLHAVDVVVTALWRFLYLSNLQRKFALNIFRSIIFHALEQIGQTKSFFALLLLFDCSSLLLS